MELEVDKKEFERIQQELIQATVENITLEYFEYQGKKWLNEDFVIPISVIQNKIEEYRKRRIELSSENYFADQSYINNDTALVIGMSVLEDLIKERKKQNEL